jgi:O-antigen ligase
MLLGIGALLSLEQLVTYKGKTERLYYLFIFLLLNAFLLLTDCRSSWGGVALSYTILIMAHLTRINRWRFAICIGLLAGGVYLVKDVSKIKTTHEYHTSDDFLFRLAIWGFAIDGITERPLTGYGNNNYFARNQKAMRLDDRLTDPHSSTLSLALQSGLVVVVLFYWLYIRMARHYLRASVEPHRPMVAVGVYWLLVPFMWGMIYNGSPGFIQVFFPLTFFLSMMHPAHFVRTSYHAPQPVIPRINIPLSYEHLSPQGLHHNPLL